MTSPDAQDPTEAIELPRRRRFVDLSPLREHPAFARLFIGTSVSGIGFWVTSVAVGLFIYDITGDTFAVALVGGISLVPMIVAGLWGGMLADAFDRRRVLIASSIVAWPSKRGSTPKTPPKVFCPPPGASSTFRCQRGRSCATIAASLAARWSAPNSIPCSPS